MAVTERPHAKPGQTALHFPMSPLNDQIHFLLTCDRLKQVQRTTYLHDGSRAENSAEHS